MSKDRVSRIDTDIEFSRRPEVIQYLIRKYGAENVCRIVTFGTLAAKQAVRDVGRCLGFPAGYTAKLSGQIPKTPKMTIQKALDESPEFKETYDTDKDAHQIIDIAMRLEGNKRHASQHACGVVLAPSSVSDFLPTSMETDDETGEKALTSQVVMTEVEKLSLIKMDLLGLKNMGVIHEVIDRVIEVYGKENILKQIHSARDEVRYQDIPLNDRATYKMLASGLTGGVFQLESEGMTKVVQQMLADIDTLPDNRLDECFERLVAAVALYRPGPMDYIPNYIAGMQDVHNVKYLTPELEPILKPTYGVIVFQEQVMQIVQKLAGYSLGRADLVRKAMGKKKEDVMNAEEEVFIYGNKKAYDAGKDSSYAPGCIANGISEPIARQIWAQMKDFAKYAFNRSHAVCYAYISALTAYMSCHWTPEFYAALLNAFIENSDKVKDYLSQASHRNIRLLPPDINISDCTFKSESGNIRFGLQGISGVKGIAEIIVAERKSNGNYTNFQDLYERLGDSGNKLNRKSVEGLIFAGAFNPFNTNKAALMSQFPLLESNYKSQEVGRKMGQMTLFTGELAKVPMPEATPWPSDVELQREYEVLGMYLTRHPADGINKKGEKTRGYRSLEKIVGMQPRRNILTGGMIHNHRAFYTKNGDRMAVFTLETKFHSIPCVVFPKDYDNCLGEMRDNNVVFVQGDIRFDPHREVNQLVVASLQSATSADSEEKPFEVHVRDKQEQDMVLSYISAHPGKQKVKLVGSNGKSVVLKNGFDPCVSAVNYLSGEYRNAIAV